jgi:hypothetical protein
LKIGYKHQQCIGIVALAVGFAETQNLTTDELITLIYTDQNGFSGAKARTIFEELTARLKVVP